MNLQLETEEFDELFHKYEYAKQRLETEIDILMKDFAYKHQYNPVEHVKSRIKTKSSILEKLKRRGLEPTIENVKKHIDDVVGVRIVCSFLTDVYDIVSILSSSKNLIVREKKDYISNPKSTGYTSYHLIVMVPVYLTEKVEHVFAEIQIRTIAMDFWASLDHKIQYKFEDDIPEDVKNQMYDYSITIKELDKKILALNEVVQKYKKNL